MNHPSGMQTTDDLAGQLLEIWRDDQPQNGGVALSEELDPSLPYDFSVVGEGEDSAALDRPIPPKHRTLVAEGDSWFDYPIKGDLLDALRKRHGYRIYQVSKAGARLEDMVYGVERNWWGPERPQIFQTLDLINQHQPEVVLISGGGNDIAGTELPAFLNRKARGVPALREAMVDDLIFHVFQRAYTVFIKAVRNLAEQKNFKVTIVGHDYDFPVPDGRGYSVTNLIPGFAYTGPWLKPAFDQKGYSIEEGREIVAIILRKFSQLQRTLAAENPDFLTARFQGSLNPTSHQDWDNEMHPTWSGFVRLAAKMNAAIQEI